MTAVVQSRYGAPADLALTPVARPEPRDGEVLVRVAAASVNPADYFIVTGRPFVLQLAMGRPALKIAIRGSDVSGTVESVGAGVTHFSPGDRVFGWGNGSFAELLVTDQGNLAHVPTNVDLTEAAAVPMAATVALQALRDHAPVGPGTRVLINGAAGGIGTFAVQIAKHLGAEVTGVCSTRNVELVRSLGADHVIDYTVEDFTTRPERYDVILDNVSRHSLRSLRRVLTPKGTLIPNGGSIGGPVFGSLGNLVRAKIMTLFVSQRIVTFLSTIRQTDLVGLAGMLESGAIAPVIDTTYPLTEVTTALEHVGAGHARGKVLVRP